MNRTVITCALSLLLAPSVATSAPITSLYVVGDSLSDQGNASLLTGGTFPPAPYAQRASNGPVAVERLADALGVTLAPSEAGGTNYAVLGAATGLVTTATTPPVQTENLAAIQYGLPALAGTSLQSQALALLADGPMADPFSSLVFVWGGANDFFLNPSAATAATGVANIFGVVTTLYAGGARNFLVPNLPDLSMTPSGLALLPAQRAGLQALTVGFNNGLRSALNSASMLLPGITITQFDTFAFFNTILADPAAFGFTNTTTPCLTGNLGTGGIVCGDPGAYVFWDSVHPTAAAHRALGEAFAQSVVPEPAALTFALVSASAWLLRHRRRGARGPAGALLGRTRAG